MHQNPKKSICFVLTSPYALNAFLLNHLHALADHYAITACTNTQESPVSPLLDPRIELLHFPIARQIRPWRDMQALLWLLALFRRRRFDAVHSITPKGGLLAMLAAKGASVPHRTHTFTGQIWANRTGFVRELLKTMDRLIAWCATGLQADSHSQARFLEDQGIGKPDTVRVFGQGSICGVDLVRFANEPGRRVRMRGQLGIPQDATVFVFLGRLQQEKGVLDLAEAFSRMTVSHPQAWLLFVGPDEGGLADRLRQKCGPRCLTVGLTPAPQDYLDAGDVLCLPSYREGFGSVVIEAAAMGLPAVASRIYGLSDAVQDESTGLLFPVGDSAAIEAALVKMLDPQVRQRYGEQARRRAQTDFSAARLTEYWVAYYDALLSTSIKN